MQARAIDVQRLDRDLARQRLRAAAHRARERADRRRAGLAGRLDALSPLAVLSRGYSLTFRESDGSILREAGQARAGDAILVRLARGRLRARVSDSQED